MPNEGLELDVELYATLSMEYLGPDLSMWHYLIWSPAPLAEGADAAAPSLQARIRHVGTRRARSVPPIATQC